MGRLYETCPKVTLVTFGPDVGLPTGQMGSSEVGHTNTRARLHPQGKKSGVPMMFFVTGGLRS